MDLANTVVGWLQVAMWLVLGIAAGNVWRKRRDGAASWLAASFLTLASVVIVARFLPQGADAANPPELVIKLVIAAIVVFISPETSVRSVPRRTAR